MDFYEKQYKNIFSTIIVNHNKFSRKKDVAESNWFWIIDKLNKNGSMVAKTYYFNGVLHKWRHREGVKDFVTTELGPFYKTCADGWGIGVSRIVKNCVTSFIDDLY